MTFKANKYSYFLLILLIASSSFLFLIVIYGFATGKLDTSSGKHTLIVCAILIPLLAKYTCEYYFTKYTLTNEAVIIEIPFKKTKKIKFDQIVRLEESNKFVVYLTLYLKNNTKEILLLDNIENFTVYFLQKTKDLYEVTFDSDNKAINLK